MDEIPSGISAGKFPSRTCAPWAGTPIIGSGTGKRAPAQRRKSGHTAIADGAGISYGFPAPDGTLTSGATGVDLSNGDQVNHGSSVVDVTFEVNVTTRYRVASRWDHDLEGPEHGNARRQSPASVARSAT